MAKTPTRQNPFRMNKYQRRVIAIPVYSILFLNIIGTVLILSYRAQLFMSVSTSPESYDFINQATILILMVIWFFFLLVTIWAFIAASDLVGAFERITRELTQIIAKGSTKNIIVRQDDHPANELIKQINILIKQKK